MKVSELIALLQKATKDGDREVELFSDEWTEDLETKEYQQRWVEKVKKHNGKVRIMLGG